MTRTVVVGLDGASWDLLDPWIENGKLPNLARIRDTGSWSTSRSCLPPSTFPNWKCYSSGKNPGKFGVFWFERVDFETESVDVMSGADFETAEIWDYLSAEGYDSAVVNMPTMYPPRDIDALVVCGGPDAVDGEYRSISSGYTNPDNLEEWLDEEFNYEVHPTPLLSSNEERGEEVDAILRLLELRFEVALRLLEDRDLDFLHVTLFYLNVLQHFFWDDDPTYRAWTLVDEYLGKLDALPDTNLVVMSDHGCARTRVEFAINEWLAQNGYLSERFTVDDLFFRLGLDRENALSIAKRLGIVDLLSKVVPEAVQQMVPQRAGIKRDRKFAKLDLEDTKALASGQGPIYVNPNCDRDAVVETLVSDLKNATDEDGNRIFVDVKDRAEVYSGPFLDDGPDIVAEADPGVVISDGMGRNEILHAPQRWRAENTPTGIFVANGPDFEPQGHLGETRIVDIAPTLLASFGVAVPSDIDGRVLPMLGDEIDVGTQDPILSSRGVTSSGSTEVADRLKQLGYME